MVLPSVAGCANGGLGACEVQPDISGAWTIQLTPLDVSDGGAATIPRSNTLHASLEQVDPGSLSLGKLVWGSVASDDPNFFGVLQIPRLTHNGGSKTGATLGCQIQINIPLDMPVTDDDTPPMSYKLQLGGAITAAGMMIGDPTLSSVILDADPQNVPRSFSWTGQE